MYRASGHLTNVLQDFLNYLHQRNSSWLLKTRSNGSSSSYNPGLAVLSSLPGLLASPATACLALRATIRSHSATRAFALVLRDSASNNCEALIYRSRSDASIDSSQACLSLAASSTSSKNLWKRRSSPALRVPLPLAILPGWRRGRSSEEYCPFVVLSPCLFVVLLVMLGCND